MNEPYWTETTTTTIVKAYHGPRPVQMAPPCHTPPAPLGALTPPPAPLRGPTPPQVAALRALTAPPAPLLAPTPPQVAAPVKAPAHGKIRGPPAFPPPQYLLGPLPAGMIVANKAPSGDVLRPPFRPRPQTMRAATTLEVPQRHPCVQEITIDRPQLAATSKVTSATPPGPVVPKWWHSHRAHRLDQQQQPHIASAPWNQNKQRAATREAAVATSEEDARSRSPAVNRNTTRYVSSTSGHYNFAPPSAEITPVTEAPN